MLLNELNDDHIGKVPTWMALNEARGWCDMKRPKTVSDWISLALFVAVAAGVIWLVIAGGSLGWITGR